MTLKTTSMAKQTKQEWMRLELPYGLWICADAREVLFNRWYQPIWHRMPGQPAEAAVAAERIPFTTQSWFYKDGNPPWSTIATRHACEAMLASWNVPLPNPGKPRVKPRSTVGLYRG